MILEFVIYLVVVIVIALSVKVFVESLEDLYITKGDAGLGMMTVSISSIIGCYYFFNDAILAVGARVVLWPFSHFLSIGSGIFVLLYVIHQCFKDRLDDTCGEQICIEQEKKIRPESNTQGDKSKPLSKKVV